VTRAETDSQLDAGKPEDNKPAEKRSGRTAKAVVIPTIPGYEILGELGRGGMGVVYKSRQTHLKRIVALKMILAGAHAGPRELERFRTEAEAVARLQHPNIVQIYEVGEHDGLPWFSLEFVDGGSLADRLRGSPQAPAAAAEMAELLARAVSAAHDRGIVHRDLKPANVLLTGSNDAEGRHSTQSSSGKSSPERTATPRSATAVGSQPSGVGRKVLPAAPSLGIPKVTDFGLAKQLDSEGSGQTQSGAIMGTPSYMAPEQAAGQSKDLGPSADVYAVGAILYEMLTGRPPFRGATILETLEQVRSQEPVPPRSLNSKVPRDLETITLKCLEKDPGRRYASAKALGEDLARFRKGEPIWARPVGTLERAWKWGKRRPTVAGLLAAIVVITVVGFVLVFNAKTEAEVNAENAIKARKSAEQEKTRATEAEGVAKEKAYQAEEAEKKKTRALEGESEQRALAEKAVSTYTSAAAYAALSRSDFLTADEQLDGCPASQRGWEWRYLKHVRHNELFGFLLKTSQANSVAFHPDGQRLALGMTVGTVQIWDLASMRLRQVIGPPGRAAQAVTFSPDGQRLAASLADSTVDRQPATVVWNLADGRELHRFAVVGGSRAIAFSPDGKRLAVSTRDTAAPEEPQRGTYGIIQVHDLTGQLEPLLLRGHTSEITALAFSLDGKRLVSGGDGTVRKWDLGDGRELVRFGQHGSRVTSVAFSPTDPDQVASGDINGVVLVWSNSNQVRSLRGHTDAINHVRFSPDGQRVLSCSFDRTARVWAQNPDRELYTIRGHTGPIIQAAFSPDGRLLATVGGDRTVRIWDGQAGQGARQLVVHANPVTAAAFSPDSQRLALGGRDGLLRLYIPATGQGISTVDVRVGNQTGRPLPLWQKWQISGLAFSPDGQKIAVGGHGGAVVLLDGRTGKPQKTLNAFNRPVSGVAFSPDGSRLAASDYLDTVKVWDASSYQEVALLEKNLCSQGLAFSPDGKFLLLHSSSRITMLDASSWQKLWDSPANILPFVSVAFRPDSQRVAASMALRARDFTRPDYMRKDSVVRVWDARSGHELYTIPHDGEHLAYTPDGKRLVSLGRTELKFWDGDTPRDIFTLPSPNSGVDTLTFSPDGQHMAVTTSNNYLEPDKWSSIPGTVTLYDAPFVQSQLTLRRHNGAVTGLAFSPDGKRLFSGGGDLVLTWDVRQDRATAGGWAGEDDELKNWKQPEDAAPTYLKVDRRLLARHHIPLTNCLALELDPAGSTVALALRTDLSQAGPSVQLRDAGSWKLVRGFPDSAVALTGLARSPAGRLLATARRLETVKGPGGARDVPGSVKLWDTQTGEELLTFNGHSLPLGKGIERGHVSRVVFSPDGKHLASAGTQPRHEPGKDLPPCVKVWDPASGKEEYTVQPCVEPVFSPDGKLLVTLTPEVRPGYVELSHVELREAVTGVVRSRLSYPARKLHAPVFHTDSRCLAVLADGCVVVFDVVAGTVLCTVRESRFPHYTEDYRSEAMRPQFDLIPSQAAFSPNGKRIAVGYDNGIVKVWDLPLAQDGKGGYYVRISEGAASYFYELALKQFREAHALGAGGKSRLAEEAYQATQTMLEPLIRDHPDHMLYQSALARLYQQKADYHQACGEAGPAEAARKKSVDLWAAIGGHGAVFPDPPLLVCQRFLEVAQEMRKRGNSEGVRDVAAGLVRLMTPLHQQQPQNRDVLLLLVEGHVNRAMALSDLRDYKAALPDWDGAISLVQPPMQTEYRYGRAVTLVRLGEHARATAEADAVASLGRPEPLRLFGLARIHGRAAKVVRDDAQLPPQQRERLAEKYANRAMDLLTRANGGGAFREPVLQQRLGVDKDLDALRERDDFKALVGAVIRKSEMPPPVP
jgi:WD40 repeat protein/serine/threonine protein kinase